MRFLFILASIIVWNGSAHADQQALKEFSTWAEKLIASRGQDQGGDNKMATIPGTTTDGKKCALFVTRKTPPDFYLSLGVGPSLETDDLKENDYIGGYVNEFTMINMHNKRIDYMVNDNEIIGGDAENPDSVRSQRTLQIELDDLGRPVTAVGVSSRMVGQVECVLR